MSDIASGVWNGSTTHELGHFIDGSTVTFTGESRLPVVNPSNRMEVGSIARGTEVAVSAAVDAARAASLGGAWAEATPSFRSKVLLQVAERIRINLNDLAALESLDVGKPISQARREVESAARAFEFAASAVDKVMGHTIPVEPGSLDFTLREPWGVTAHIVPWNYPLSLAARSVAPALAMGNAVVLKPAEDASLSCTRFAALACSAGLPPGALNVVTGYGHEAGAALAGHAGIDHLTFTGSVATGSRVAQMAAQNIVPVTLELGGKSPQIVFADADLASAIPVIVRSFVSNAGQTCVAGTRLLVEKEIHDQVIEALADHVRTLEMGPPDKDPDLGPLINARQLANVESYLSSAADEGLMIVAGGKAVCSPELPGYYVEPTVFDYVPTTSRLFREEVFGPVLSVTELTSVSEAIELANHSEFGLSASVWTRSLATALKVATSVRSGQINVNTGGLKEGLAVPFGGYKRSGYGRDKGMEGMLAYTQLKNVAIRFS